MDTLPKEIYTDILSKYLSFQDYGHLIKTCRHLNKIYDTNDFWKEIYVMTCPNKWEITNQSEHLNYSNHLLNIINELLISYEQKTEIDIHKCINILKIWNCQNKLDCQDITHCDINTLEQNGKIRNYDYKRMVLDKARTRLTDKCKNIIFLKQSIFPDRLEWYDIIGNDTFKLPL